MKIRILLIGFFMLVLFGCAPAVTTPGTVLLTPPTATLTASPVSTATAAPPSLWIEPAVPDDLRQFAVQTFGLPLADSVPMASVRLGVYDPDNPSTLPAVAGQAPKPPESQSIWVYALVGPFPTVSDGFRYKELRQAWGGQLPSAFAGKPLLMAQNTYQALVSVFGGAAASGAVRIVPAEGLKVEG